MRHAAKIESSERLQKVLAILEDGDWHGSFELMSQTKLVAIGSAISEIRANGFGIESRCVGQGRYEYRLGERVEEGEQVANEGSLTLAESSPRTMGATVKGKSEIVQVHRIPDMKDCQPSDFPAPPRKWDDWSHVMAEEGQGRMF